MKQTPIGLLGTHNLQYSFKSSVSNCLPSITPPENGKFNSIAFSGECNGIVKRKSCLLLTVIRK